MKTVYLAGPITGLSYGGCTDWRNYCIDELGKVGIKGLSPLRMKAYLEKSTSIKDVYNEHPLSTGKGITTRDRHDCQTCDVILVNFLGAKTVSIGTVLEIAWADAVRTPIVLVMEKENNIHEHSMIRELAGFRVETLDEGLNIVKAILV